MQPILIVLWIITYLYISYQSSKATLARGWKIGYTEGYRDGAEAFHAELNKALKEKELANQPTEVVNNE